MTREKTIRKVLDKVLWTGIASDDNKNILTEALVEALEQESNCSENSTSSTAEDNKVTLTFSKSALKYDYKDYVVYNKKWFRSHYGAEIDIMFGDNQYIEPTTKNDLGVDAISREQALNGLCIYNSYDSIGVDKVKSYIKALPSVTPIRPKGHWIKGYTFPDGEYWKCDKCNELIKVKYPMHYCNNCGSDNRELKE